MMVKGITYIENWILNSDQLFHHFITNINWDERMTARKTASYGVAYNYSQISYPDQEFIPELKTIIASIEEELGFTPNNCLLNYYLDGKSSMGFHSDQTDILYENTGVVIISLGETRTLRFRRINAKEVTKDYLLTSGSLFYMTDAVQEEWQHAIPKTNTDLGRISLTFRKIK
ncbi:alpha-ketoglutarate-dependent dioxygenase AlkB family protein [Tenacibaculum jejuense]|uniref:2OG-Fe(II) oxygenase n=1 Tax=Tenacibaculum jejuense TaxID=584609 RepID=A0A238U4J9_9FLAO|nr:alpha-ketoglutarate-dependent dioxygenase AlkB [Tenacibaculum jejuense]SNR14133.1 2OG-Fe(II) oxygenase [Tenacibaculum jejuense]